MRSRGAGSAGGPVSRPARAAARAGRTPPPSPLLAFSELPRAMAEFSVFVASAPLLAGVQRGDGHPVLVLPGFTTSDVATAPLRAFLRSVGYDAHGWELGRNVGPRSIGAEGRKLVDRIAAVHSATGRTVSLVGWSLGGVMARLVSRQVPELVRQVVSLGAPFTGSPRATNVWRAYELLAGHRVDDLYVRRQLEEGAGPPPVPSTAIWSRTDGIVAWRNCVEPYALNSDNIEVVGSHCGLAWNAAVLYAVADRLAQREGHWVPFDRGTGLRSLLFPSSGHV